MNDKVSSMSSQIIEKNEVIPEAILPKVSKLIDSIISRRQEKQRRKYGFLEKKDSIK